MSGLTRTEDELTVNGITYRLGDVVQRIGPGFRSLNEGDIGTISELQIREHYRVQHYNVVLNEHPGMTFDLRMFSLVTTREQDMTSSTTNNSNTQSSTTTRTVSRFAVGDLVRRTRGGRNGNMDVGDTGHVTSIDPEGGVHIHGSDESHDPNNLVKVLGAGERHFGFMVGDVVKRIAGGQSGSMLVGDTDVIVSMFYGPTLETTNLDLQKFGSGHLASNYAVEKQAPATKNLIFKVGELVEIQSQYLNNWGQVKKGMTGTVINVDDSNMMLLLDVPSFSPAWHCSFMDVKKLSIKKATETVTGDEVVDQLANLYCNRNNAQVEAFKRTRNTLMEEEKSISRRYTQIYNELEKIDFEMRSIVSKATNKANVTTSKGMFKHLLDHKYDKITVEASRIVAVTKPVSITYGGVTFDLGQYNVYVEMRPQYNGTSVQVTRVGRNSVDGKQHPHVSGNVCCFGTYSKPIAKAIGESEFLTVLNVMSDFLNSCYQAGWYLGVWNFGTEEQKALFCNECHRHNDACVCEEPEKCGECDNYREDCSCSYCPDSGDTLEHGTFPDSMCKDCRHCVVNQRAGELQCKYDSDPGDDGNYTHYCDIADVPREFIAHITTTRPDNVITGEQVNDLI